MIRCWISRRDVRRHLDQGAELSRETLAHLEICEDCAASLTAQRAVVQTLRAGIREETNAPFLRARIMRSIQSGVETPHSKTLRVVWTGVGAFAVVVLMVAVLPRSKTLPPQATAPAWELPKIEVASVQVTNSLETELESLKSDTQRAARALAASFMPSER
jgi:hypothetical protein